MPRWLRRFLYRLGHRGSCLMVLTITFCAYGSGILFGYRPTFTKAYDVPIHTFGWIWVALGWFVMTGIPAHRDSIHYSIAELWMTAWALLLASHWSQAYGWTAAVSWGGLALGVFVVSAWPEVSRRKPRASELPDLPTFEELVSPAVKEPNESH
jgi:hypothetical protein